MTWWTYTLQQLTKPALGSLVNHTKILNHDASQALSDHAPVSAVISLKVNQDERLNKSTYYKMDSSLLAQPAVLTQAQAAWEEQDKSIDPRKAWVFGWARIKRVLIAEKKKRVEAKNESAIKRELCSL
jgi:hypothetical protein